MRIHCLQHVSFEGPAAIAAWAANLGHKFSYTHLYLNEPLPDTGDFDWLVVMGGPMGVYDESEYPWLIAEKAFLKRVIAEKKIVLGICLGAQLLAEVLGAKVYPNKVKEIGWFPVRLTAEGQKENLLGSSSAATEVFHWHGDTFDLPPGAVHLAESEACRNQAFLAGDRVLGLQFHLELTAAALDSLLKAWRSLAIAATLLIIKADFLGRARDISLESTAQLFYSPKQLTLLSAWH